MKTQSVINSTSRSPWRPGFVLSTIALACFALLPKGQATDLGGVLPGGNTADGSGVLVNRTTGTGNSGFGDLALNHDTTGNFNTATGNRALASNITGLENTANGYEVLFHNTTINGVSGDKNTAVGFEALFSNTIGFNNTANGYEALLSNNTGEANTAVGWEALFKNTTAGGNTAVGAGALTSSTGEGNTAVGEGALGNNTSGSNNTALGNGAGIELDTGSNNIDIGANVGGVSGESNTIRIGAQGTQTATYIAGISGVTTSSSTTLPVIVDSNGQLGTTASSERFKKGIKPMDKASEAILALKPVTFHYKNDSKGVPQFGLIAEEVANVNPDLIVRDARGEIYTVRYDAVNAMLLNEFLKEHRRVEGMRATIARQQKQIEVITEGLQKVSDELKLRKPAPQTVDNNPYARKRTLF